MDEDSLAPMADALSATLAVFILLICFFVMAQVDAVSRQIKVESIGDQAYLMERVEIDFEETKISDNQLIFFNSFNPEDSYERVDTLLKGLLTDCTDCTIMIKSNYPEHNVTKDRATRRALVNGLKMAKILKDKDIKYELNIMTKYNYYFIEFEVIK